MTCLIFPKFIFSAGILLIFTFHISLAALQSNSEVENAEHLNARAGIIRPKEALVSLQLARKALIQATTAKDRKQVAVAYDNIGRACFALGQFQISLENLRKAQAAYKKLNLKINEASTLIAIFSVFKEMSNYVNAAATLDESLKIYEKLNDSIGIANILRSRGSLEWKKNNFSNAFEAYQKAFFIALRNKDQGIAAQSLNGMGISCGEMGQNSRSLEYFQKSLALNIQNKDSLRIGELYNLIGNLSQRTENPVKALACYDSASTFFIQCGYRKEYAGVRRNQGLVYKLLKKPEKAILLLQEALTIYTELNDTAEMARSYIQAASLKISIKKYSDAHKDLLSAINLCMVSGKISEAIEANNILGLLFSENGNFRAALEIHQKSVNFAREIIDNNKLRLALTYEGNDLMALNRFEEAVVTFREIYELSKTQTDIRERASAAKNLARAEVSVRNFTRAEELLRKSLADFEQLAYQAGILQTLNELGNLYESDNKNSEAINVYNDIIAKASAWNDLYYFSLCNRKAGEVFMKDKNIESAKPYLDKALEAALKTNNQELLKNCWHSLSDYFEISGDYLSALKYFRLYTIGKDSIDKLQQAELLILRQANFDISQKNSEINHMEKQVELLEKDREIRSLALKKKNIQKNFAILIVLLLLLVVFLLWKRYQFKIKKEAELSNSLDIQRLTNQKLEESEKELQNLNASKDRFFSIIAHDIKNPLAGILGFGEHLVRNYKTLDPEEIKEIAVTINDASHNLYSLLENLLSWSRLQTGRLKYSPTSFNLKEICSKSIELQKINAGNKGISLKSNLEDMLEVHADINMFMLVIRNLLSNAVKFTNKGGTIVITSGREGGMAIICIRDNGVGISEENILKLFHIDGGFSTRGTSNEEGTGLGLLLCKECVEKNGGTISVSSKPGEGSTFCFTVPLN